MPNETLTARERLSRLELIEYRAAVAYLGTRFPAIVATNPEDGSAVIGALLATACSAALIAWPDDPSYRTLARLATALGVAMEKALHFQAGADADALMARIRGERA